MILPSTVEGDCLQSSPCPPTTPENHVGFAATSTTSTQPPASSHVVDGSTPNRMATADPRQPPQRFLEPELALIIKEAKLMTGKSWRRVSMVTGLSKAFLIQLSNGQRRPSLVTVETLGRVLPIDEEDLDKLRDAAARRGP